MYQSFSIASMRRALAGLAPGGRRKSRRRRPHPIPWMESLEGRALLANITASAVISSSADGANFDYTVTLTNSSSSASAVGTFWYAWNLPNVSYLATSPVSVTPPAGWSDEITNASPSDGYGILYTANSSASYLQPGASLVFHFTSADPPSSVNGNSVFYPGVAVDTSFVYPQGAFSDAGHEFVATPTSPPSPTPTPTATPPVTITGVRVLQNKKHMAAQIIIDFSGGVNAPEAGNLATYTLTTAGKKGSFTAKNAKHVLLSAAAYADAAHELTLTPRKAFALTKPVQLVVHSQAPGGLQDSAGQFIGGGTDGVFVLTRKGVTAG